MEAWWRAVRAERQDALLEQTWTARELKKKRTSTQNFSIHTITKCIFQRSDTLFQVSCLGSGSAIACDTIIDARVGSLILNRPTIDVNDVRADPVHGVDSKDRGQSRDWCAFAGNNLSWARQLRRGADSPTRLRGLEFPTTDNPIGRWSPNTAGDCRPRHQIFVIASSRRRSQAGRRAGGSSYKSRGNCAAKVRLARCEYGSAKFNEALEAKVGAIGGDQVWE